MGAATRSMQMCVVRETVTVKRMKIVLDPSFVAIIIAISGDH